LGDRRGIQPVKSWVLVCFWQQFDWSFACPLGPVVSCHYHLHILNSNKIQNEDIMVLANPGAVGNVEEKQRCAVRVLI